MNRYALLPMMALVSIVSYTQHTASNANSDQQQLLKLESDLLTAENAHDARLFDKVVAEDWVNASPTGQTRLSKKEVAASIRESKPYKVSAKNVKTG